MGIHTLLEETACVTYANIIQQVETPGTPLHEAWSDLSAPTLAKTYWKLSHHRDVNHTFATMGTDDPNPFVEKHRTNAVHAWRLQDGNKATDVRCSRTLGTKAATVQGEAAAKM